MSARGQAFWGGLAFALLFGVGSAIWGLDMPEDGTPVAEVLDWYEDVADRIVIGGSMSLIAIGAFIWFAAAIRSLISAEDVLANTAFGGAVLGMATGIGAESINLAAALRAQDGELTEDLCQSLFEISQIYGSMASGIGVGVFAVATGVAALRIPGVMPSWVAQVTIVIGLALLTPLSHVNWVPGALMVLLSALLAVSVRRGGGRGDTALPG